MKTLIERMDQGGTRAPQRGDRVYRSMFEYSMKVPFSKALIDQLGKDFATLLSNLPLINAEEQRKDFLKAATKFADLLKRLFVDKSIAGETPLHWAYSTKYNTMSGAGKKRVAELERDEAELVQWVQSLRDTFINRLPELVIRIYKWRGDTPASPTRYWKAHHDEDPEITLQPDDPEGRRHFEILLKGFRENAEYDWNKIVVASNLIISKLKARGPTVDMPHAVPQELKIEGFNVLTYRHTDDNDLRFLASALKLFKRKASSVCPWMVRYVRQFKLEPLEHWGGLYEPGSGTITISTAYFSGGRNPEGLALLIAHELAHHVYYAGLLSGAAQEHWNAAVRSHKRTIDMADLYYLYVDNHVRTTLELSQKLYDTDPEMSVAIEYLARAAAGEKGFSHITGYYDMLAVSKAIDHGMTTIEVPAHPVTAYGGTNPGETFAEAIAHLVIYGKSTVPDPVLRLLKDVLGSKIKIESKRPEMRVPESLERGRWSVAVMEHLRKLCWRNT